MECEHNFVRSGYGNDLICTKCGYAAKQAVMPILNSDIKINIEPEIKTEIFKRDYMCKFVGD